MKVAIMQPYVFPYLGYFQLIQAVDTFVFYDDVNFIKKGFINRNSILVNGKAHQFTIPCSAVSQNKLIKNVPLHFDEKLRAKFIKTLHQAYKEAPFFETIFPLMEPFFNKRTYNSISDMAIDSVLLMSNYLGLDKNWVISSQTHKESQHLKKENRILAIAKKENASTYINPIGGMSLYSKAFFENQGIHLYFLQSEPIAYKQFKNEFVPWLSILDVVMFNSKEDIQTMLTTYKLI
ncbi:WbqC family protein [Confluentibacter flavum]|uniref:WbqC-like protein n=1 Tax=Confluentibacter flavum TaxID=1909700 RepID=A0A2N3HP22_9FLAO|nr:WbqC family protein [Confluentibacter flavum]PKQ46719.1 hypothetical protein CSW08_01595 [Confluentibacter flavum]